jgi:Na+-driven multidrug efflux pump
MTKDLTEGNPLSLILGFSIPVLLGYLFQQLYNVTDTIIVGKCIGVEALAAVGSTGAVNFLIIGFVNGVCSGFSIPVANRFGAKDYSSMRRFIANIVYLTIFFSIVMTVLTVVFCRPLMRLMLTPEDIIGRADSYIRIIFAGIPLCFLYNITSGIIRSLGDSRTPVFFLVLSSVLNIALDLIFIINFHWDVQGAALATIISQGISGIACLLYMIKKYPLIHSSNNQQKSNTKKDEQRFDPYSCRQLCAVGIPMGLQYSITAIGSVILQTSVNTLGSAAVASVTAGQKVSMFFCTVFDALGTTMATFGGQNTGAGKYDRLRTGVRDSMLISIIYSIFAFILFTFAGKLFISFFINSSAETQIINNAHLFLLENSAAYILLAAVNIYRFMIQGMGYSRFAVLSGVLEMIARALIGIFMIPRFGFICAGLASPLAWIFADCFLLPAFHSCRKKLSETKKAARQ